MSRASWRGWRAPDRTRRMLEESGLPALGSAVGTEVIAPAKAMAVTRALAETRAAAGQVGSGLRDELGAIEDPSTLDALLLRAASGRGSADLPPRTRDTLVDPRRRPHVGPVERSDLLRSAARSATSTASSTTRSRHLKSPKEWTDLSRLLATRVSEAVADVFAQFEAGVDLLRADVVTLIGEESLEIGDAQAPPVERSTSGRSSDRRSSRTRTTSRSAPPAPPSPGSGASRAG